MPIEQHDALVKDTDQAVDRLQERTRSDDDVHARLDQLQQEFEAAAEIKDEEERDMRVQVLERELDQIRQDASKETEDLAKAVMGLNGLLEEMGFEYSQLEQLNSAEQGIIDRAQARLDEAERKLEDAQEIGWNLFGRKDRAIQKAETEVETAKNRLEEAKAEAAQLMRHRLMNADMEDSLQRFQLRVQETVDIMRRRHGAIEEQLASVSARKEAAFEARTEAATALERARQEHAKAEDELRAAEDELQNMLSGTEEEANQNKKVSDLRSKVERLRGEMNTAQAVHQSKEKFAKELEVHEVTQTKLRDNHRTWIQVLESDTEERIVTFRSRLDAMKGAADQEVAQQLDEMGSTIDERNAEYMASIGQASDKIRLQQAEKHPERMRAIEALRALQSEGHREVRAREEDLYDEFVRRYGIDPLGASIFDRSEESAEEPAPVD